MSKSVTVEEAVALMVNMDYIPTGFTLLDMTAAFREQAEADHHNARIDKLSTEEIQTLKTRMEACVARDNLAQLLLENIKQEISNLKDSMIKLDDTSGVRQCITLESLSSWASTNYGIGVQNWETTDQKDVSVVQIPWENITIKIYDGYRICYFSEQTGPKGITKTFQEINLMGKRKNMPNSLGSILIKLSKGNKYPIGKIPANKNAAAISKLRSSLKQLTGLSSDPFYPFNEADGYKSRFKLIDDSRNADERAKNRAQHESFDETTDYESENDAAADWLSENS